VAYTQKECFTSRHELIPQGICNLQMLVIYCLTRKKKKNNVLFTEKWTKIINTKNDFENAFNLTKNGN